MHAQLASRPGSRHSPNEDWAGVTMHAAVVLDGVTAPSDLDTGCMHSVPWYVHQLGSSLLARLAADDVDLIDVLAMAIKNVADLHVGTCDLANSGTPSATVAVIRSRNQHIEWLVLADAAILIESDDGLKVITDGRVNDFAAVQRDAALSTASGGERRQLINELVSAQRKVRNQPGGYWVAGSNPDAAREATVGATNALEGQRCALMSDGVTRLVEFGDLSWAGLFEVLEQNGPDAVLNRIREIEASDSDLTRWPRYKASDDATAVVVRL